MEIFTHNPKLKENLLNKLIKNILEIVKRLDESINFISSEIKVAENKIFNEIQIKNCELLSQLFNNKENVLKININ